MEGNLKAFRSRGKTDASRDSGGGKGTRLRPLTIHTPKPIVPIINQAFLFYQMDLLNEPGIKNVILCLSYQPRKINEAVQRPYEGDHPSKPEQAGPTIHHYVG